MTIQTIKYRTSEDIPCKCIAPTDVILCVPSSLVEPVDCGEGSAGEDPYAFSYIEGVLESYKKSCSGTSYLFEYTITYDDEQLDEGATLTTALISGVICADCIVQYIDSIVGFGVTLTQDPDTNIYRFTNQYGCVFDLDNITLTVADQLTATGTDLATAFQLEEGINKFDTVAAATGAKLDPNDDVGDFTYVFNGGANTLRLYPPVAGGVINNAAPGASWGIPTGNRLGMVIKISDADDGYWIGGLFTAFAA